MLLPKRDDDISEQHSTALNSLANLLNVHPLPEDTVPAESFYRDGSSQLAGVLMESSSLGSFQVSDVGHGFTANVVYDARMMRYVSSVSTISFPLIPSLGEIEQESLDTKKVSAGSYMHHVLAHEAAHALQWQALVNHYAQQSGTDLEARRKAYNTFFSSPHKEWVEGLAEFAAIYSAFQNEQENGRSFSVLMLGRHLALMPKSIREYLSLRGLPKGIEGKLSSAERREVEEINTRVQEIEERTSHLIRGHPAWEGYKALRQPYANGFGRMMAVSTLWPDVSFRDLFLTPFSKGDSLADYEVKVQETKRMVGED